MSINVFLPWYKAAIIITCSEYKPTSEFPPLSTPKVDGPAIKKYLVDKCLFPASNVRLFEDRPQKIIKSAYNKILEDAKRLGEFDRNGIYFIYYSGHGTISGPTADTYGHTVDGDELNLDDMVKSLSARENTYVIGLFDCCRSVCDIKKVVPEKKSGSTSGQYMCIYGCNEDSTALSSTKEGELSKVTASFLKYMQNPLNGDLTPSHDFPISFLYWKEKGKEVITTLCKSVDLMPKPKGATPKSDVERLFNILDMDGNGKITVDEVMSSLQYLSISGGNPLEVRHYMSHWMRTYGSSDGELNLREFIKFHQKLKDDLPELQRKINFERRPNDKACSAYGEKVLFGIWEDVEKNYKDKPHGQEYIPWKIFSVGFWNNKKFQITPTDVQQDSLKILLNVTSGNPAVRFEDFNIFVKIFACLVNDTHNLLIDEIVNTAKQTWFKGFLDRNKAVHMLKNVVEKVKRPGIVRISASQYFFCLSSLIPNDDHMLLHPEFYYEQGFVAYVRTKASEKDITLL